MYFACEMFNLALGESIAVHCIMQFYSIIFVIDKQQIASFAHERKKLLSYDHTEWKNVVQSLTFP